MLIITKAILTTNRIEKIIQYSQPHDLSGTNVFHTPLPRLFLTMTKTLLRKPAMVHQSFLKAGIRRGRQSISAPDGKRNEDLGGSRRRNFFFSIDHLLTRRQKYSILPVLNRTIIGLK